MRRVVLFRNGSQVDGKVVLVTHSLEELLKAATQKFGFEAKKIYTPQGGEIDDIKLIRDDDILYVTGEEPFIKLDLSNRNFAPSIILRDPINNDCCCSNNHKCSKCYTINHSNVSSTITSKTETNQLLSNQSFDNDTYGSENAYALLRSPSEDVEKKKDTGKLQDWVKLNVGGKLFTTSRSTLVTKEPTSMLARMFAQDEDGYLMSPSDLDENGAYLIDRSPTYFEPILNYLRNGQLIFDNNVNPAGILQEARFFRIESLVEHLENLISSQQISQDISPLTRRDVINALITTPHTAELRFQGVNLAGSDLSRLDLRNINFKYACLHGCRMIGANLSWCCLERADLSHAIMESAQLKGVKMLCANLEGANMRGCNFETPNRDRRTDMEGVNLKGANLECSNMAGINLRVANLKNANLQNCDLRGAVLAGADMEGASVTQGPTYPPWMPSVLGSSSDDFFRFKNLKNVLISPDPPLILKGETKKCDLSGSDLHEANLRGANLKDATFEMMLTPIHMSQTIR